MANQDSGFHSPSSTTHPSGAKNSRRSTLSPLRRAYEAVAIVGSFAVLGVVSAWEFWKEWRR